MSEYMHNDDVADLLHETEKQLAEALRTLEDLRLRHARLRISYSELRISYSELDDLHRKDLNTLSLVSSKLKQTQTELDRVEKEHARGF